MERGYLRVWRKIEDSQSYNRSALHRAILLTIFVKANWKSGFFCGRNVAPGQLATSVKGLSEELREPRTTVMRALRDIEKDGVIKVENVGNKWTMITLVNWSIYQAVEEKSGQPVVNQWLTSGQPVDTIKEGKKERIEESSLREVVGATAPTSDQQAEGLEQVEDHQPAQKPTAPPCPHQQIVAAYHELLPELPCMKVWNGTRQQHLAARWRERWKSKSYSTQAEGLAYFRKLFEYIGRECDWLMGRIPGRNGKPFLATLEWIVTPGNFAKIIEGNYARREVV